MLLQLLLGGVAGLAVIGRLAWQRITSVFRPGRTAADATASARQDDPPENGAN